MIALTVLSFLTLLPLHFAKPAPRKSFTEMFKCKLNFISMDQAQKAVQLGCSQMQVALPTSLFPASFIESELFDLTNIVLFTWPVFPFDNVLREDHGRNRVVFDSSCRLVGLIHIKPTGPERCLHLMEVEDLNIAHDFEVYNTRWTSLQLYGYKYDNEFYSKNSVEEFVNSNFKSFRGIKKKKEILDLYPSESTNLDSRYLACTILPEPGVIKLTRMKKIRRVVISSNKRIIGICRKKEIIWKPLAELRYLDDLYRANVVLKRKPEVGFAKLQSMNYNGIHLSVFMLRSHLIMACNALTKKKMGIDLDLRYPLRTNIEAIPDRPMLTWPLRIPENSFHDERDIRLVIDERCNLMGVTSQNPKSSFP
ncbi:BgtA-21558 [Blumeria graminis f. sp. tritici]|uniref:BgtA-21558 n=4 Tax=Blumeria graminis TaxID=34373 RepID=A0A9X9L7W5_BLUGR|nr:BgtA-21558 [Blumeria graminis f. sp. tritici]